MKPTVLPEAFFTAPAVFAVGRMYHICVPVSRPVLFWVRVDDKDYFDHVNGVLRSDGHVRRVAVPTDALDAAGEYTVCYRAVIERKPYFSQTEAPVCVTYPFRPVPNEGPIRLLHLSDTHSQEALPTKVASHWGDDLDLFVLNGDIPNHSGDVSYFDLIFRLCDAATHGQRTCLFSRGNHDTRGKFAEHLADYVPTDGGHSYFTFRVGSLWGLVLDCGEDKEDAHPEYGNTVCCHAFREEETDFLRAVVNNAESEYAAPGVRHRIVVVHNPFGHRLPPPFDIEEDCYRSWVDMLNRDIQPSMMLSGHLHRVAEYAPEDGFNDRGLACKTVIGSTFAKDKTGRVCSFTGAAITIHDDGDRVEFITATE